MLLPETYTPPLSVDFPSAADRWLPALEMIWRVALGYWLDEWQVWLIRAVLEVYPEGHARAGQLRFREAVISLPRQNGKTEIAAALALIGLLRKAGALVIGIASSAEQARLVYDRAMRLIRGNPSLAKLFDAITDTRGIRGRDGGQYLIRAARSAALQGLPVDLGIADEVHLLKPALWSDLLNGTGGRPNCIVVGITTAGDDDSELLKHLYANGESAAEGSPAHERFGFWRWQYVTAEVPKGDDELRAAILASNPAAECGRMDVEARMSDARSQPAQDVIRYLFNSFVARSAAFIPLEQWRVLARLEGEGFPAGRPIFTVDRTPGWEYAAIIATIKADGITYSEVVASIVHPTLEWLVDVCVRLARWSPITYGMDGYQLKELATELKRRGLPVTLLSLADNVNAAALTYAAVSRRTLRHAGDDLLAQQIPQTTRRNHGEGFRISRKDSGGMIDAVIAMSFGVLLAETVRAAPLQVF